jgi:hypothetical protein
LGGCRSVAPLPPVNTNEPGWTVRQGQALWLPNRSSQTIAGDLLVATRDNGEFLVQFTKVPFPSVIARRTRDQWQIQFSPQNRRLEGRGKPSNFIWFELPRALAGQPLSGLWHFERKSGSGWVLQDSSTGESLQGFLTP